jgi:hypothetical protein
MVKAMTEDKIPYLKSKLAQGLTRQFKSMWSMLRQAIAQVSEDQWAQDVKDWSYSLRVYHIIETAVYYTRADPEGMPWGERLGTINWWEQMTAHEAAQQLSRDDMTAYLDETEGLMNILFATATDDSLLEKDGFHWFSSIFEKLQYMLRHSTYHIGELALALREWDCERIKWE